MDSHRDKIKLLEHFNNSLKGDKARPQIAQLSELGLVELTRKRQGKNIYELFGQTCHTCGGLGQIAHLPGKLEAESIETSPIVPPAAIREPVNTTTIRPVIPAPTEREKVEIISNPTPSVEYDDNRQADLLSHPNYQEQGGNNNGNRRRRRSRRNDLLIKDELIEQESASIDTNLDRDLENNSEDRRSRSQSRSPRRDEANLEKVTVEMSDLEQEIYALMGVSPLIYAEQESKDPKSVLVYVKKPGEELDETETRATSIEEEPSETEKPKTKAKKTEEKEPTEPEAVVQAEPEIDQTQAEPSAKEEVSNGRRRRRRRSSATNEA